MAVERTSLIRVVLVSRVSVAFSVPVSFRRLTGGSYGKAIPRNRSLIAYDGVAVFRGLRGRIGVGIPVGDVLWLLSTHRLEVVIVPSKMLVMVEVVRSTFS